VLPARALFSDTFGVVTGIAPIRDITVFHGWQGADGRGCDTPRYGKGMSLGGVLPNRVLCLYLCILCTAFLLCSLSACITILGYRCK
jgi:hypothetical protein